MQYTLAVIVLLASNALLSAQQPAEQPEQTQDPAPAIEPESQLPPVTITIEPSAQFAFRSDIDQTSADVAIAHAGVGVNISRFLDQQMRVSLGIDADYANYDFGGAPFLPGVGDPLQDAWSVSLAPSLLYIENEKRSWIGGGKISLAAEPGADAGDSVTFSGFGAVRWQARENLALTFGASVGTRLEKSVLFIPVLGVEWTVNERVTVGTEGLGLAIRSKIDDSATFVLRAAFQRFEYRLDDEGPAPDGILRDASLPISAGIEFRPDDTSKITVSVGMRAWQELKFDNASGNEIAELNTDPALFLSVTGSIAF